MLKAKMIKNCSRLFAAAAIVLGSTTTIVSAEDVQQSVLREVMRECKLTDISDAIVFVAVPGSMAKTLTNQEIDSYVASKTMFKQSVVGSSSCWTLERWRKYARSVLKEQQAAEIKAGNTSK
jgi:hypothetical protein